MSSSWGPASPVSCTSAWCRNLPLAHTALPLAPPASRTSFHVQFLWPVGHGRLSSSLSYSGHATGCQTPCQESEYFPSPCAGVCSASCSMSWFCGGGGSQAALADSRPAGFGSLGSSDPRSLLLRIAEVPSPGAAATRRKSCGWATRSSACPTLVTGCTATTPKVPRFPFSFLFGDLSFKTFPLLGVPLAFAFSHGQLLVTWRCPNSSHLSAVSKSARWSLSQCGASFSLLGSCSRPPWPGMCGGGRHQPTVPAAPPLSAVCCRNGMPCSTAAVLQVVRSCPHPLLHVSASSPSSLFHSSQPPPPLRAGLLDVISPSFGAGSKAHSTPRAANYQ